MGEGEGEVAEVEGDGEREEEEALLGIKGSSAFMSSSRKESSDEKMGLLLLYISLAPAIWLLNQAKRNTRGIFFFFKEDL